MKWILIILAVALLPIIISFIITSISCWIHKEKYKYVLLDKILNWEVIKNSYKEFYKFFSYLFIALIILFVLYFVLKDYSADRVDKKSNNIANTLKYFNPKCDSVLDLRNCYLINVDSILLSKDKNFKKFQTDSITKVFILNKKSSSISSNSKKSPANLDKNDIPSDNSNKETSSSKNSKDKFLEDTSNIIGHTSNLLSYITIFFAIIGVLGGIGIYKYLTTINNLEKESESLRNKTLDAGLTTISAVPMVEATQITSDEYNLAIETITNSIVENRDNINENPKYSKLLIVEALHYWNLQDYGHAVRILENARKLAYRGGEDDTVKTINYHLARTYKQWAYEEKDDKQRDKYFKKASNYAKNTFEGQKNVINLSIASIKYNNNKIKSENLVNALKKCIIIKDDKIIEKLNEIYKGENDNNNIKITDFASLTAFTVIALINKDEIANSDNRKYCAKESLKLLEEKIHSQKGANIKASWYNTMADLSKNTKDKKNEEDKYKELSDFYAKQAKDKNKKFKIFDPVLLIEKENQS